MITEVKSSTYFLTLAAISLSREFAKGDSVRKLERLRNSGLLNLLIPEAYGGCGETWFDALKVVREIAKADGYLGQLLGYHYVNSTIPKLFGTPNQNAYFCLQSVNRQWLWGNSINVKNSTLILTPDGDDFRLDGVRCGTGIKDSDVIVVKGKHSELDRVCFVVLPSDRQGITVDEYIDPINRSNVVFDRVFIHREEVLGNELLESLTPFASLLPYLYQLIHTNLNLGIVFGELATAKQGIFSNTPIQSQDLVAQYGDFWVDLSAAASQADRVASLFQAAWDKGEALSVAERSEVALEIACAQVFSTKVGLNVTSKMSKLMGKRTVAAKRCDRHWRKIHADTLHKPLSERVQEVGNWVLNEQMPLFTFHI